MALRRGPAVQTGLLEEVRGGGEANRRRDGGGHRESDMEVEAGEGVMQAEGWTEVVVLWPGVPRRGRGRGGQE